MGSWRYLNTVLTMIAVLLTLNFWTRWTGGPTDRLPLLPAPAYAVGIPDAGHQRKQMVDELKRLSHQVEALTGLFRSGQARVKMEMPPPDRDR